jgi:hypothetical protein
MVVNNKRIKTELKETNIKIEKKQINKIKF